MASFRPRLQISSLVLQTDSLNGSLLKPPSLTSTILHGNLRNFWFKSRRKPIEYGTGNCGEPAPSKIEDSEPCKGTPSKCIEEKPKRKCFFFKKPPKEKPSNCVKEKPPVTKLSMWEQMFGPDPKRSWPDPCTCRIANRQRRKQRRQDPRLFDTRYQETAGDVFLFTRVVKRCSEKCMEPQPKPPPSFKLPKGVLYSMIGDGCNRKRLEDILVDLQKADTGGCIPTPLKYRIPYEEMRPPERRRKSFSCREGIRPEDVEKPVNEELDFVKAFPKVQWMHPPESPQRRKDMFYRKMVAEPPETEPDVVKESSQKRSRIEQLKMMVQRKSSSQCFFTF
ncbi:uncharacterized protein LOC144468629 [Augochlora pura]